MEVQGTAFSYWWPTFASQITTIIHVSTKHFWKLSKDSPLFPKAQNNLRACKMCLWQESVHSNWCCSKPRRADKDIPFSSLHITALDAWEIWEKLQKVSRLASSLPVLPSGQQHVPEPEGFTPPFRPHFKQKYLQQMRRLSALNRTAFPSWQAEHSSPRKPTGNTRSYFLGTQNRFWRCIIYYILKSKKVVNSVKKTLPSFSKKITIHSNK